MLVQTLLISLVTAFAMFDYQLGTLYAFRPIVTCPLIGLILGDLPTGLAIGASLELLFMGNISIGAYLPPDEKVGSILACAFAITLGKGTEAALALAMPIATLSLAISNVINGVMPIIVDKADVCASKGNLKSIYAAHWAIGLIGLAKNVLLVGLAYYLGAGAVQNLLDWIPAFIMDGFCYARQTCSQARDPALLLPGLLACLVYERSVAGCCSYRDYYWYREVRPAELWY